MTKTTMLPLILIAAVAKNRVIGCDNQLIWNLPEDMAHFKALTKSQTVIMGRKTWESLPVRFRPLPGRRNIVISRQTDYPAPGAEVCNTLDTALELAQKSPTFGEQIFIIGGAEIYRQSLPQAERLILTEVDDTPAGDAFFPEIDAAEWRETAREPNHSSIPAYAFVTYQRNTIPFPPPTLF